MAHASADLVVRENLWIPLRDGRRLGARLWLPAGAPPARAPAIVEYMPYRKRDQTRPRDEPIHSWFAARGFAALRVDTHGAGESDGILRQEFRPRESDDAVEMIAWIAAQPWCDGGVAMFGKSWGGFAALHAAARRPPALKALVAVCAGEDRFDQALHFTGGVRLIEELWWSDTMLLFNLRPPDPEIVGTRWEAMWRERLDAAEPWLAEWLRHPRRDAFWTAGSLAENPDAIACAVYAVGGWADYISASVPRALAKLKGPRWGLVGPWGHHYPQDGVPGPAIGFLQECERFFDATLRGRQARMADEPMLRAWMPEARQPGPHHVEQTGRWVAEREWPSPRIAPRAWFLGAAGLVDAAPASATLHHRSPLDLGLCAPEWLSAGVPGEAPADQRGDDGRSLAFDTAPLESRVEILGPAELELDLAVDRPVASLVARLCDVAPDGTSVRVALGALNLLHRDGPERAVALESGRVYRIRLLLPETAHAFRPGHRIRLALGTSYWPVLWPDPEPVTLTVRTGASRLVLPVRPQDPRDGALRAFAPPESGAATPITVLEPAVVRRKLKRDGLTGVTELLVEGDGGILGPARRYASTTSARCSATPTASAARSAMATR